MCVSHLAVGAVVRGRERVGIAEVSREDARRRIRGGRSRKSRRSEVKESHENFKINLINISKYYLTKSGKLYRNIEI